MFLRIAVLYKLLCMIMTGVLLVGCSNAESADVANAELLKIGSKFKLTSEPTGAVGVADLRGSGEHNRDVTVVGRVGGGINPWIEGTAAFILVDAAAMHDSSDECCDEGCNCQQEELQGSTALVKFLGSDGQVLPVDSRELLGLKERDTVVVRGKAHRDNGGNVSVLAEGIYTRR